MAETKDITYYRFLSEVRSFLSKLMKDPIKAKPSKTLEDNGFGKTKLINVLMKRDILERHERILDSTNSEEKTAKYTVKYKVKKEGFERKIQKIYIKYFEKNEPEKINECDCGACDGGATSTCTAGDYSYVAPFGEIQRRPIGGVGQKEKKKGKEVDPSEILGKTVTAEGKKPRRIFITEEQFNLLQEGEPAGATTTSTVGAMGDYTAGGLVLKKVNGKPDPTIRGRKIHVKQFK